jgi:hypothetical protein
MIQKHALSNTESSVHTMKRRSLHVGNEALEMKEMTAVNTLHMTLRILICFNQLHETNFHTVTWFLHQTNVLCGV